MTDDVKEGNVQAAKHLRAVPSPVEEVELLFRQHHDQVYRTAYRVTGSSADAEDVLQTVFLRLVKRDARRESAGAGPIDLSPSPGSYLHRAAVNASLDLIRSRTRSNLVPIEDVAPVLEDTRSINPEHERASREMQKHVREALAGLGTKAAEVVVLKYFEGHSNVEIARLLGTSQMVVGVMLHRARTKLRKELGKVLEGSHETV
ncbi:MAG TPA: sigma-70 family RNA polymerase sigma factor [Blastocatellia bacterium]|nr:sigma-70 family RNA polymerase sigma factor [Blastocatellia bacterium]